MRTTITLDDRLFERLRKRAAASGTSISGLIERAVRLLLQAPAPHRRDHFELITFGERGQLPRGISIKSRRSSKPTTSSTLHGADTVQLPDVTVLIYAHRLDAPEHERYATWLKALVEAPEPFAVAEIVLAGFLRIVTNPKIFRPATPMPTALAFCRTLIEWPRAVFVTPSRAHWDLFVNMCSATEGALVSDAYIAALAVEDGCELITTDSDSARFPNLRWRHPLGA